MQRVMITGGSAGVGRATAIEFAKHGAAIGLVARDLDRLEAARAQALEAGAKEVAIYQADVADFDDLERAGESFFERFGGVDVWINNAMTSVFARFEDITPSEYQRVTKVTYLGTVWGTKIALRQMELQGYGRVLQVGSALAYRGIPLQSAYCGAKHATQGMMDSLRAELLHDHSKVSIGMVQLPAVNTPQFNWSRNKMEKNSQPVPPIFQPEVAARGIYWMAQRNKRELLLGFPSVKAVMGNKLLPAVGDWYLAKTGFKSQQTDRAIRHPETDNLFQAPKGNYGARGSFDQAAKRRSVQLWLAENKALASIGVVLLSAIYAWLRPPKRG